MNSNINRDCSIVTGADSKIARQEQGESTWDPLNASELAPSSANGLIPSLIAWAKSQPPGNDAIVSINPRDFHSSFSYARCLTNPSSQLQTSSVSHSRFSRLRAARGPSER